MSLVLKSLSDEDIANVAAYYAAIKILSKFQMTGPRRVPRVPKILAAFRQRALAFLSDPLRTQI